MLYRLLSLFLLCANLLAGSAVARGLENPAAEDVLSQYKTELQSALRQGMSKGVTEAIEACRVQAPKIAMSKSQGEFRVGRTSHRLRNPQNTAPEWVAPILGDYLSNATDRKPVEVTLSKGRAGYVEPILLQPLCTACHGESVSGAIAARIKALYPNDQAVGFKPGDLRGVFWIEYPTAR